MNKRKKGFTLAEVLVCVVIIGIIMALSVTVINGVKGSYTTSTYYVYKSLEAAVTSIMQGANQESAVASDIKHYQNNQAIPSIVYNCSSENGLLTLIKGNDNVNSGSYKCSDINFGNGNSPLFCQALASLSNLGKGSEVDCGNLKDIDGDYLMSAEAFLKPNFTTSNGYKYYISKWSALNNDYGFRLVSVDVNMGKGPNINRRIGVQIPDIVTFMVTDTGLVLPVGVAATDIFTAKGRFRYLPTVAKGYYFDPDNKDNSQVPEHCAGDNAGDYTKPVDKDRCNFGMVEITKSNTNKHYKMTFAEAYCAAFGEPDVPGLNLNYCTGVFKDGRCPVVPGIKTNSNGFDLCSIEPVKPVFRYDIK